MVCQKNGAQKTLCHDITFNWLVVSTHLKNMLVKVGILPEWGREKKKYLKPPPSYTYPDNEVESSL